MPEPTFELVLCHTEDDRIPLKEWLKTLDITTRNRIRVQIDKMEDGNFGDARPIGSGASESRLHFGPGYRIYFGLKGSVVHLLHGGSKATQTADIRFALELWKSHHEN